MRGFRTGRQLTNYLYNYTYIYIGNYKAIYLITNKNQGTGDWWESHWCYLQIFASRKNPRRPGDVKTCTSGANGWGRSPQEFANAFPMPTYFASKSMLCPWNAHENYLCGHESLWSQQELLRIQKLLCPETLVGGLSDPQARDGRKSTRYWETKHGIFEFDMTLSTVINNVLIWLDLDRDNVR